MGDGGLFSIGHSTQPIGRFMNLLMDHRIDVVADVRSSPYSKFNPQFNRETIAGALRASGMRYVFFGRELGARADDPSCYVHGQVSYSRLAARPEFREAIERLLRGAVDYRIALMCAEKEPLECHRTILVSQELSKLGKEVRHIHYNGELESHSQALERLIALVGLPRNDLFRTKNDILGEALMRQEARIAFQEGSLRSKI